MPSLHLILRHSRSQARTGFTLVELLIVIVIVGLIGGMAASSYQGVSQTARAARTRSIIATIESVLQEKYDAYKHRPLAVEVPDLFTPNSGNSEVGLEVLAMESARVRLSMTRDLQRMEMPDRFSDIALLPTGNPTGNATVIEAAVNPVQITSGSITRVDRGSRRMLPVNWFASSLLDTHRNRLTANATAEHQGAECLFLIMSSSFIGGAPAIDGIPSSNIADTDGDGMGEILDGWGRPLGFIRWPVGYIDPNAGLDRTVPDDFDPLRVDYAYADYPNPQNPAMLIPPASAQVTNVQSNTAIKPFSMRPLVVSAGWDGIFGIALNPWEDRTMASTEQITFSYRDAAAWRTDIDHYGDELQGRTATASHNFVDPYLRNFTNTHQNNGVFSGLLPGQTLATDTASTERADNITNYDPQEPR